MLDKTVIKNVLQMALSTAGDFAEIFIEDKFSTSANMLSSKVEGVHNAKTSGIGIRIAKGYHRVYGYTNSFEEETLLQLASDLAQSFPGEPLGIEFELGEMKVATKHQAKINPKDVSIEDKVALLYRADKAARAYDEDIKQVNVRYLDYTQNVWIANTEGTYVNDTRTRTRLAIASIAANEKTKQTGYYGPGGTYGFEFYSDVINVEEAAEEASRIAKTMLYADECPSGKMPVVIDNGFGGVIFHEAVGHSLEATAVARGASVFTGKKGEVIANPLISAVDDGTIEHAWGSATFDDEGNYQQKRQLIKDGVLTSYMIDKLNAKRMNDECTNSGRRESYRFAPTSRMTNTFIENGSSTFDEIIAATEFGLYAKKLGGGSVNPATGDFNFSVNEGYMIRNGKIAEPVRGASLVGTGAEALKKVDMVGNNLLREQGMCGSESGSIPADVGQPTIRVSEITVGGRGGAI
ncbi:TldD/PmbA family protein [Candidatus Xianfuyuplasma coldseepsis]|uniref:TldD/PmbA family protein n=1 Tax=Candidatus Xianfuyuplasma coldseepsis TaxID=2782163 RepID=A0A7L7KSS9_9MOLU|nr:TldD/PmbA family protein [Xianfuyuplasma coldseepsis]QMS84994.1 TldD/PmbA family protein [Xianfuyuplasma coldseepsis]